MVTETCSVIVISPRSLRADRRNPDPVLVEVLHDDVAGPYRADLVLELQCLVSERRIAPTENPMIAEGDVELLARRVGGVGRGYDVEARALQSLGRAPYRLR
jgi:hypothetical protein